MTTPKVKVELDFRTNAVYYKLRGSAVARTTKRRLNSMDVLLEYDGEGRLVGVEVLNFKRALQRYAENIGLDFVPKALEVAPTVR